MGLQAAWSARLPSLISIARVGEARADEALLPGMGRTQPM